MNGIRLYQIPSTPAIDANRHRNAFGTQVLPSEHAFSEDAPCIYPQILENDTKHASAQRPVVQVRQVGVCFQHGAV
jgi:hypothetical protein